MWTAAQMDLFEQRFVQHGAARWNDQETSKAAAKSVDAGRLLKLCLEAIAASPNGLTNDEIAALNPKEPLGSISPRSGQLKRKGLIKDSGERRATRTGSKAIVWVLTELGREQLKAK